MYLLPMRLHKFSVFPSRASIPHVPVRWIAPVDPYVKVNYDASFKSNASIATLGVVVRDKNGFILGAQCASSYHVASSIAVEAQAAIHGLNFASDLGFQWVEMEGDSRAIVTKLLSASSDTSEMSALIGEAKGLARNFRDYKFFFHGKLSFSPPKIGVGLIHIR
ncbi:hypothetical protein GQ457_15G023360 [Hibiscus cannabinus]